MPHTIVVNEQRRSVAADPATPLLYVLRNDLELNGPRFGCGLGECGACTVLIDGLPARSCVVPLGSIGEQAITTLEGLNQAGLPGPVQQAFIDAQAAQCGYCLNGMILMAHALLQRHREPTEAQIRSELRHNLCRCGTHVEIIRAIRLAAERMR